MGNAEGEQYPVDERMDGLLTELASVVVDELIALKNMGMKPADIEQLYTQEIPAMPVVPARKRRRRKEAT